MISESPNTEREQNIFFFFDGKRINLDLLNKPKNTF